MVAREAGDALTVEVKGVAKKYDWPASNLQSPAPDRHYEATGCQMPLIDERGRMETVNRADMQVRVEGDGVDFRTQAVGGQTIAWVVLPKGADFGPALKGLLGDACQCPHWGYMIKGRLLMRTNNGEKTYEAGQAFYWGPGHVPEALEDCEYIDISPTDQIERVIAHVTGSD